MKNNLLFILLLASCLSCGNGKKDTQQSSPVTTNGSITEGFDPGNTYIFIAGVLKWQDPSLASFDDTHRKDEELYKLFLKAGVKQDHIVYLKDNQATYDQMNSKFNELLHQTNANSTFVFYYAGHGARSGNNPACFANYDYSADKGFAFENVSKNINQYFKGKEIVLLADCCYSGGLIEEAKKVSSSDRKVISFTSSTSSNISTGNWTFTQTIIDCLEGSGIADRNSDGKISLEEVKAELFDAMKFREKQMSGTAFFNTGEDQSFNLSVVKGKPTNSNPTYIYFQQDNKFEPARVLSVTNGNITGELYHYSDKETVTVTESKTKPIAFADYPVGTTVEVEWNGKYYPATITAAKDGFHYIHYTGYDDSWNEWMMYDRIKTSDRKPCEIEWQGQWYPGEMLQQKDGKYFVHYEGFKNDWDEWVGKERIKF